MVIPGHNDDENGFRRQKNECFPAQKDDERGSRRQKNEFPAKKRRRNGFRRQK